MAWLDAHSQIVVLADGSIVFAGGERIVDCGGGQIVIEVACVVGAAMFDDMIADMIADESFGKGRTDGTVDVARDLEGAEGYTVGVVEPEYGLRTDQIPASMEQPLENWMQVEVKAGTEIETDDG